MKNKKALVVFGIAASFFLFGGVSNWRPGAVNAGGGLSPTQITASTTSAAADGKSTITFTVFTFNYECPETGPKSFYPGPCADGSEPSKTPTTDEKITIYTTSTNNTFGSTSTGTQGLPYVTTGADGKTTFTVASSTAGSKKFIATHEEDGTESAQSSSVTVTFSAPASTSTTTSKSNTTTTKTTETPAPETPKLATLETAGQPAASTNDKITIANAEPLTVKGTTVANGVVKLYIFSTPREATTTADANGNWSYEVTGLEPGDHHIEAEVTDPKTNKTSTRATLATFTISKPIQKVTTTQPKATQTTAAKTSKLNYILAAILFVAVATGGGLFWWFKRKKMQQHVDPPSVLPSE